LESATHKNHRTCMTADSMGPCGSLCEILASLFNTQPPPLPFVVSLSVEDCQKAMPPIFDTSATLREPPPRTLYQSWRLHQRATPVMRHPHVLTGSNQSSRNNPSMSFPTPPTSTHPNHVPIPVATSRIAHPAPTTLDANPESQYASITCPPSAC